MLLKEGRRKRIKEKLEKEVKGRNAEII